MEDQRFREFIEQGLAFEKSFGSGGSDALCAKEQMAWDLYESGDPAGQVLLGDALICVRISYCRKDIEVVPFARKLLEQGFHALTAKEQKNHWDWYYLGICHEFGRGTPVDHAKASECFKNAKTAGNEYAELEEIWSAYLSGRPRLEAIFRFRACSGRLQKFATIAAQALALLELGPVRETGSPQHVFRILELTRLLHQFYYHTAGSRHINVQVGREMKSDVDPLKALATPAAAVALFLISKRSPSNPTGEPSAAWLRAAVHPENEVLVSFGNEILDEGELKLITETCEQNGWGDSEVSKFASTKLREYYADDSDSFD